MRQARLHTLAAVEAHADDTMYRKRDQNQPDSVALNDRAYHAPFMVRITPLTGGFLFLCRFPQIRRRRPGTQAVSDVNASDRVQETGLASSRDT